MSLDPAVRTRIEALLTATLEPLREKVLATGRVPFFNPIGLPIGDIG